MKTRVSLQYLWMIVACCLYFAFFTIMPTNVFFPRSNLMQWLNIISMMLKSCYNHILTLYFWGSVKQSILILHFFNISTFYILKTTKNLFQVFNHGLKDLNRHVRTISWHCSFDLPLYSFFKDEWFIMRKLVITMIMTMVNHVFVALWLHSWPWVWNIKTWPWNNHG